MHGGPLRKLCDSGTRSILGCPLLCIIEHRSVWKYIFHRRPLFSYLLLLLEPFSPGWGVPTSSRKVMTEHLRLQYPCSSVTHHTLESLFPHIGKRLAFSPGWKLVVPVPSLLSQLWSSHAPLCTYSRAERLTGWQSPGIPRQGCRDIILKLGWTYLMRSLSY